jgi:hypothetical protein
MEQLAQALDCFVIQPFPRLWENPMVVGENCAMSFRLNFSE